MEGKPQSGENDKDQNMGEKKGAEQSEEGTGEWYLCFVLGRTHSVVCLEDSQPPLYLLQMGYDKWGKAMQVMK